MLRIQGEHNRYMFGGAEHRMEVRNTSGVLRSSKKVLRSTNAYTVKHSGHSKIDKTKILLTNHGS